MAYRLDPARPLHEEIGRVARSEIGKAVDDLRDTSADRGEAIHDARKRLKKLRGLLRLVRAGDPALYRAENARFRDAARRLSAARDRTALIEALDALKARFGGDAAPDACDVVRTALELKRQAVVEAEGGLEARVAAVADELEPGVGEWEAWEAGQSRRRARAALLDGIEANYRRGRKELKAARRGGDAEIFHDLRKRVKYHAMHLRLLSPVWPEMLEPVRKVADRAADDLGRDHDYAVMLAEMAAEPDAFGAPADIGIVAALIGTHQEELRAAALLACGRLFAERPPAFRRRMARYLAETSPTRRQAEDTEELD